MTDNPARVAALAVAALIALAALFCATGVAGAFAPPQQQGGSPDAGAGAPQDQVPRQPYVVSSDCLGDFFSEECGARVPELGWLNVIKMCHQAGMSLDETCRALLPVLPDCDVQGVACLQYVPRDAVVQHIGDICATDPGAPGCGALARGGEACLHDPACTTEVTSYGCAEAGGGICPSLENLLENFGGNMPQVDRATPQPAATVIPFALFRHLENTALPTRPSSGEELRAVIMGLNADGTFQAVGAPPGPGPAASPQQTPPQQGDPNTTTPYNVAALWNGLENSFRGDGTITQGDRVRAGGAELQLLTYNFNRDGIFWSTPGEAPVTGAPIAPFSGLAGSPEGLGNPDVPTVIADYDVFQPISDPDPYISVPGGRDPTVQLMIVAEIQLTAPGRPPAPEPPALESPSLWSALRRVFSFRGLNASVHAGNAVWVSSVTRRPRGVVIPSAVSSAAAAGQGNPLQMFLTNIGSSTGEAFTAHILNNGDEPMDIDVKGLVVEPLKEEAQRVVQQQLQRIMPQNPVTAQLDAYCLEFLRLPPSAEQMFQLAPKALQDQFAPVRNVLDAAKQLNQLGLLPPDSDPTAYFHSITQWAVWAEEEDLEQDSFTDAFVDHTRKQVEAAGNRWTDQFDNVLRGAAPARWQNITRILEAATGR